MKRLLLIFGCLVALPCAHIIGMDMDTTIHKYDSVDMIVLDSLGNKVVRHMVDLTIVDPKGKPTPPQNCDCPLPSIEIKETITLPAGQPARVVSEPTPTGIKLTFYIPQGAIGPIGPAGPQGIPGTGGTPCANPPCAFYITPVNK